MHITSQGKKARNRRKNSKWDEAISDAQKRVNELEIHYQGLHSGEIGGNRGWERNPQTKIHSNNTVFKTVPKIGSGLL